jgi:hypothetical protein
VKLLDKLITVGSRKFWNGLLAACVACLVDKLLEFMDVHGKALSRQRSALGSKSIPLPSLRSTLAES